MENLPELRRFYFEASESEQATEHLGKILSETTDTKGLAKAYRAAYEALLAKHSLDPFFQFSQLQKANNLFFEAVREDSNCVELRFLRFSVQHRTPEFLGMSLQLTADRKHILAQLPIQIDTVGKKTTIAIAEFVRDSKRCFPQEQRRLQSFIDTLKAE
ncbi:MAG: hypothetical protein JJT94_04320 [Bernardetiaceae bacterium]|nr:hypothetical protein [Bernardetiaceae bacterium]